MSKLTPFDFIKSINDHRYILTEENEKDYVPFVINRGFSYFNDTLYVAHELNKMHHLPVQMQYDFLYHAISKGKRFSKWYKETKNDLDIIINFYQVNKARALEIMERLSEDEYTKLVKFCDRGGRVK